MYTNRVDISINPIREVNASLCEYHFIDGKELWAWIEMPPFLAKKVNYCPWCGFHIEKK